MSAVRKPSLSDPLSLDGLEPLLDQIFAPAVLNEFAPDVSTFERTNNLQFHTDSSQSNTIESQPQAIDLKSHASQSNVAHVDFYAAEAVGTDSARNQLLTKQLTELKEELKSFQFDYRHLQLELATKEDQLHYMPELFSKVLSMSALQSENAELKIENAALLNTIERLRPKTYEPSMGRRILNRFFGA
ncbi:MAG: hypothetical protein JST89_22340 [Cyanobacteria bacterium SZAS-4]|nr:hypothetical protein [Cyanobacteria bacterium SZAS-4]